MNVISHLYNLYRFLFPMIKINYVSSSNYRDVEVQALIIEFCLISRFEFSSYLFRQKLHDFQGWN
jgi:hypothetical protein